MGLFFDLIGYLILFLIILGIFGVAIYMLVITIMGLIGGALVLWDRIKKRYSRTLPTLVVSFYSLHSGAIFVAKNCNNVSQGTLRKRDITGRGSPSVA